MKNVVNILFGLVSIILGMIFLYFDLQTAPVIQSVFTSMIGGKMSLIYECAGPLYFIYLLVIGSLFVYYGFQFIISRNTPSPYEILKRAILESNLRFLYKRKVKNHES